MIIFPVRQQQALDKVDLEYVSEFKKLFNYNYIDIQERY